MELSDAVHVLAALAQPARLQIFRLLVQRGEAGLSAGEIANELDVPKPTLSFHLKELNNAGLIQSSRDGRSIHYFVLEEGIRGLLVFLTEDCCQGRPELCLPDQGCGSDCSDPPQPSADTPDSFPS